MTKRNPEATCATCPYFGDKKSIVSSVYNKLVRQGKCKKTRADENEFRSAHDWCGEHPDFFVEEDPEPDEGMLRFTPKPGETPEEFKDYVWRMKEHLRKLP